jgi:DNA-binding IclR family transcriptional regulator
MSNATAPADLENGSTGGGVQSVDRAISVLEILARRGETGVSDVAGELGVHKSTAFRLLGALENRGLVEQARDRGKYRLGFGILRLASALPGRLDLTQQGHPVCELLAGDLGETVNLAVIQPPYVVNVYQARGPSAVAAHNWVGQPTPLHATSSGKVLLAYESPERRAELLAAAGLTRYTDRTITSMIQLEQHLDPVTSTGYAYCIEEYEVGLHAMAAPVRDHTHQVVAAVSVSGPAYRFTAELMHAAAPRLIAAADQVSFRMGHLG